MLFSLGACTGEKGKRGNVEEEGREGRGNLNLEYSDDWPVSGPFKLRFGRWSFFANSRSSKGLWDNVISLIMCSIDI